MFAKPVQLFQRQPPAPWRLWTCVLLMALAAFVSLRDPMVPGSGLDSSWVMATDHAAHVGAAFGRDYVFTYGPYFRLATHLFDPQRYGLVIVYDMILVAMLAAPALIAGSTGALAALVVVLFLLQPSSDSVVMTALLAVFLAALLRRDRWTLLLAAVSGPLVLSKFSFVLVLAPLLILADLAWLMRRRAPAFTPLLAASTLITLLIARQSPADFPALSANSLAIILGYGHAMQVSGPVAEIAVAVAMLSGLWLAAAAALLTRKRLEPVETLAALAALAGLAWFLFVAFKAGFVRQDTHTAILFEALALGGITVWGFLAAIDFSDTALNWRGGFTIAVLLLAVVAFDGAARSRAPQLGPAAAGAQTLAASLKSAPARLEASFQWLTGERWAEFERRRQAALDALKRGFPSTVWGAVDVIPYDQAEVIASGLRYAPRPVIQSYSAYTPHLQALDRAYFAGPEAPDTLLVQLLEIDTRLPTSVLGPSLPVIAARYDAVGLDPLGAILRKRAKPRAVAQRPLGQMRLPLNHWVDVPRSSGVVAGKFDLPPRLAGRLTGLAFRDSKVMIHLRGASGTERVYRFIPGMAQLSLPVSPMPEGGALGALTLLDPGFFAGVDPVVAIKIEAQPWAYGEGTVAFTAIDIAPGLASGAKGDIGLLGPLALSDRKGQTTFDGIDLFAPADTQLSAPVDEAVQLVGGFGVRGHPPGPPDDGVDFTISAVDAAGGEQVLLTQSLPPGPSYAPVSVTVPAHSRLVLRTAQRGNANFDWSYWRVRARPAAAPSS